MSQAYSEYVFQCSLDPSRVMKKDFIKFIKILYLAVLDCFIKQ